MGIAPINSGLKTWGELELEARATDAIAEYRLVKDGVVSYNKLGYATYDGGVVYHKLLEYLIIDSAIQDSIAQKQKQEWQR